MKGGDRPHPILRWRRGQSESINGVSNFNEATTPVVADKQSDGVRAFRLLVDEVYPQGVIFLDVTSRKLDRGTKLRQMLVVVLLLRSEVVLFEPAAVSPWLSPSSSPVTPVSNIPIVEETLHFGPRDLTLLLHGLSLPMALSRQAGKLQLLPR